MCVVMVVAKECGAADVLYVARRARAYVSHRGAVMCRASARVNVVA